MSAISLIQPDRDLFSWPQYWAACFGPAPFLPMSREEMDQLGWDSCDIILVTGDAYVDHPSFGMAICGRMLEAQGFRVGIISQPDWNSKDDLAVCLKRRASAWGSSPSLTGTAKTTLCVWVNPTCSSA